MLMNYSNNNDNKETSFFQRKEKNTYNIQITICYFSNVKLSISSMDLGPKVMLSILIEFSFFEITIKPSRERPRDH